MHTYDKQYNVTRSSRYGILENFIIHYYNCYASYCFISSSIFRVSLCVAIRESLEKKVKKIKLQKKNKKTNKEEKGREGK